MAVRAWRRCAYERLCLSATRAGIRLATVTLAVLPTLAMPCFFYKTENNLFLIKIRYRIDPPRPQWGEASTHEYYILFIV